jgi:methylenetetrahydrofolate reductase (NADPH)
MECPKGMRNGPCGGIRPDKMCYVDNTRKCVWYAIYKKSFENGSEETLLEVLPPVDWNKVGTETWGEVVQRVKKVGTGKFFGALISNDILKKSDIWDSVFKTIRQPEWWAGDSEYHTSVHREPVSELERQLRSGKFVIATEVTPPQGTGTAKLISDIQSVKPYVAAINFTDSSSARPKMSSIGCCKTALDQNAEPVFQIAARDTTRTGLQSTVIGANAMGINNILCISGDNSMIGPAPTSNMNILDIDSVQMLWILRKMRDEGKYLDGRSIKNPPKLFLGSATSPFAIDPVLQAIKDNKKINAGAQFFQTNLIFEPERLDLWLEQLDKRNILNRVFILIGIAPLKSLKITRYLDTNIPGVSIPDKIMQRMEKAGESASEEGVQIALEVIDAVKGKQGINGIHIMTLGWESAVQRIVIESGLAPN